MERIGKYVDHIKEELEGAKEYAECYVDYKVRSNNSSDPYSKEMTARYKEMANDELRHANYLHEEAMTEISKLEQVITPPEEMLERWKSAHNYYVEKTAWVKQMLAL